MIDRTVRAQPDIHPQHCDCASCTEAAPRPATLHEAAQSTAGQIVLGLIAGHFLITLYDWAMSGPGVPLVFGL
jgi:hypothetical protein